MRNPQARPEPPRLGMRGIRKRFGATQALDGVDLDVHAGRVHALVGENGAGKSTLMKVLAGALAPDEGEILLDGETVRWAGPLQARRAGIAMIYQELSLASHLSVEENMMLGIEPTRWGVVRWKQVRERVGDALELLGHPEIHPGRGVASLSVAAQQLVEIGRALVTGARVLVLDEPTSVLPQHDTQTLFKLVRRLRERRLAIVYISHFIEEVQEIADDVTVLRDGRTVGSAPANEWSVSNIVEAMVGRDVEELYPQRAGRPTGEVMLSTDRLGSEPLPRDATLRLHAGEVLGIGGLVGAGRTELLRTIFGLLPVRRGTIRLATHVGPSSPTRRWAQGAGMLSEDRKEEGLAQTMTVADNVTLSRLDPFGPWGLVFPFRQHQATRRWIERLGVHTQGPQQPVAHLSGGNQQKIALARLLHHDVDVLFLDEPTRGIDIGSKTQIYKLIAELADAGKAVLIVSSYLPELLGMCDRIAVMHRGKLSPARPAAEWDEHSLIQQATGQNHHP